jgi:hypothetical protein
MWNDQRSEARKSPRKNWDSTPPNGLIHSLDFSQRLINLWLVLVLFGQACLPNRQAKRTRMKIRYRNLS